MVPVGPLLLVLGLLVPARGLPSLSIQNWQKVDIMENTKRPMEAAVETNELLFEPQSACEQLCGCIKYQSFETCVEWFKPHVPCNPNQCYAQLSDPTDPSNNLEFEDSTGLLDDEDLDLFASMKANIAQSAKTILGTYSETSGYFEGDMLSFTADTLEQEVAERNELFENDRKPPPAESPEAQYAARRDERYQWPHGLVPYRLYSNYSSEQRAMLAGAMQHIENNSCVRFVTYEPKVHDYHLRIYNVGASTCAAEVGRQWKQKGRGQAVMLGAWCFYALGTIVHELMHALGFYHEQSRSDRDEYININWQNMPYYAKYNFKKYTVREITELGVPYDYDSIMHYGANYFGNYDENGKQKQTIVPKVQGVKIGQREKLSVLDVEKLNRYLCGRAGKTIGEAEKNKYTPAPGQTVVTPACTDHYKWCDSENSRYWCHNEHGSFWNEWMNEQCPKTCRDCQATTTTLKTTTKSTTTRKTTTKPSTTTTKKPTPTRRPFTLSVLTKSTRKPTILTTRRPSPLRPITKRVRTTTKRPDVEVIEFGLT